MLRGELHEKKGIKWFLCLQIQYKKESVDGGIIYSKLFFRSDMQKTTNIEEVDYQIDSAFTKFLTTAHNFHKEGSGWVFNKILGFDICIATYRPLGYHPL